MDFADNYTFFAVQSHKVRYYMLCFRKLFLYKDLRNFSPEKWAFFLI